jgi:hypothetical protein
MGRIVAMFVLLTTARAYAGDFNVDAFASFSPQAEYGTITADLSGPESGGPTYQLGVGGALSRRFGRYFELVGGVRYDYGRPTGPWAVRDDTLHVLALPIAAALIVPLGAFELEPAIALGPGFGYSPGYDGGASMYGLTGEIAVTFAQRRAPGFLLQLGARLDSLAIIDGRDTDGTVVNYQFPFLRAGATWR